MATIPHQAREQLEAALTSSEWPAPARPAFLSHRGDGAVAELCNVKAVLTERKPNDDFGGLLPIGDGPQSKLSNNAVEGL
jgi:hypothetical protein